MEMELFSGDLSLIEYSPGNNNHVDIPVVPTDKLKSLIDKYQNNLRDGDSVKYFDDNDYNENDSANFLENKSAVDLTTARFRMLVNAEDYARSYLPLVENNLPGQTYQETNVKCHFNEINDKPIAEHNLDHMLYIRRKFRRTYFLDNYCRYEKKLLKHSKLLLYRLSDNPKLGVTIDKIIQWYPVFAGSTEESGLVIRRESIKMEKLCFEHHLKLDFRELLLEYYESVESFGHEYLVKLIQAVEQHIFQLVNTSLDIYENISEICKKCGESFPGKTHLINHHDYNVCRVAPTHRCQCGELFKTHTAWFEHCFNRQMSCGVFAWHIWRNIKLKQQVQPTSNNNRRQNHIYQFNCDGCQHCYRNFLEYWNHVVLCPFFLAYIIGNCSQCTNVTKAEVYALPNVQQRLNQPHSDNLSIKILTEWIDYRELEFDTK